MLYPPVADLLTKVESRYLLVNLVAHRARQIAAEAEENHISLEEKPVTMAVHLFATGEAKLSDLDVSMERQDSHSHSGDYSGD